MNREQLKDRRTKICAEGGGEYVGVWYVGECGPKRKPGYVLVMFNSPLSGSTLALPAKKLTPEGVRQHITESNKRFGLV